MQTIEELKTAALERERAWLEQQAENKRRAEAKEVEREQALLEFIKQDVPHDMWLACFSGTTGDRNRVFTFRMNGYADIQARYEFDWRDHFDKAADEWVGAWHHVGFDSIKSYGIGKDNTRMWSVMEFKGAGWDSENEEPYPSFQPMFFQDLGNALLAAERLYVTPEHVKQALQDLMDRRKANKEPQSPEPEGLLVARGSVAEQLLTALDAYIAVAMQEQAMQNG